MSWVNIAQPTAPTADWTDLSEIFNFLLINDTDFLLINDTDRLAISDGTYELFTTIEKPSAPSFNSIDKPTL